MHASQHLERQVWTDLQTDLQTSCLDISRQVVGFVCEKAHSRKVCLVDTIILGDDLQIDMCKTDTAGPDQVGARPVSV